MRLVNFIALIVSSLIILSGCQTNSLSKPNEVLPNSTIEGEYSQTYTYRLDNGLQIILWPNSNSHSQNEARLDLLIHAGSLHEEDDQLGYAHFVEHMLFNQPEYGSKDPVLSILEELNITLADHANAYTSFGHTRYHLDIPNASQKRINKAIELLSFFAYKAKFDSQEVAKEIGVVREEWRQSEPEKETYQYQRKQLHYANSRHLERFPIGTLESIEAAKPKALQDFYQQHYHPANATLIVTGNIDLDEVVKTVARKFHSWPSSNAGRDKVYPLPEMRVNTFDIFTDTREPAYYFWLGNAYASNVPTNSDTLFTHLKFELIMDLLDERLQKLSTQQTNSLRDFMAAHFNPVGDFVEMGVGFRSQEEDLEAGVKLMGSVIHDLISNGFTQTELDNVRNEMLQHERVQQDSAAHLAHLATHHALYNFWLRDQEHYLAMLENRLPELTPNDLQQLAQEIFTRPYKIEIVAKPDAPMPTEAEVRNWITESQQTSLQPIVTQAASEVINWEINHPPGTITQQEKLDNGIHLLTLSNGIKVQYSYSDSAPGKFYMEMVTLGGFNILTPQEIINTRLGMEVMSASGLQSLDGHQLRNWLEGQALGLEPVFDFDSRGMTLEGPSDKAEVLLQLLHVALQDARVDKALYDHFMAKFEQEINDLNTLDYKDYIHEIEAHISQGNPAYRSLTIDEIQSVDADDMYQIYQQYIAGAQNYVLHIVGDISLAQLQPHLTSYIASLPKQGQQIEPKPSPKWPGDIRIEGNKSNHKAAIVSYNLQLQEPINNTDYYAQTEILSNLISERLRQTIREELGLTYSVSGEINQLYPQDPLQLLSINLECDPAQVDKVLATIDQSLNELVKEGLSQKDINQEVNMLRGDYGNHRHKANYIIWELVNSQLLDIDPSPLLDAKAAYPNIKAATLDAMLAAFVNNHHSRTIAVLNP